MLNSSNLLNSWNPFFRSAKRFFHGILNFHGKSSHGKISRKIADELYWNFLKIIANFFNIAGASYGVSAKENQKLKISMENQDSMENPFCTTEKYIPRV